MSTQDSSTYLIEMLFILSLPVSSVSQFINVLQPEPLRVVKDRRIYWVKPPSNLWVFFTILLTLVILSVFKDF